ncbi:MAG: gliding motility lipoprotein GldD [Bacteroidetes bacterium]|nr:gliding motility lipoprotein GldD [Bacteroidota bacterium]
MLKQLSTIAIPFFTLLVLGAATVSCDRSFTPKPAGYVRIETPEKEYRLYDNQPFSSFEIPVYANISVDRRRGESGWINLVVPQVNGTIHLSYKPVSGNLGEYITDCRTLAYKHTVKADGIEETPFIHREDKRFGMVYDLSGDVASAVQFFITDSTTHFLRGSLYFNCPPNRDSLKPVIDFMRDDIMHLIETTEWKY